MEPNALLMRRYVLSIRCCSHTKRVYRKSITTTSLHPQICVVTPHDLHRLLIRTWHAFQRIAPLCLYSFLVFNPGCTLTLNVRLPVAMMATSLTCRASSPPTHMPNSGPPPDDPLGSAVHSQNHLEVLSNDYSPFDTVCFRETWALQSI